MNSALEWRDTIRESPVTALIATRIVLHWMEEIAALPVSQYWQILLPKRNKDVVSFSVNLLWDEDVGQLPRCQMMCARRRMSRVGVFDWFLSFDDVEASYSWFVFSPF